MKNYANFQINTRLPFLVMIISCLLLAGNLNAQQDSVKENTIDSILLRQRGLLGKLAQTLLADTTDEEEEKAIQRADIPFLKYRNRIIRRIYIRPGELGIVIGDTTKKIGHALTHLANQLHATTKDYVIKNHLFFSENERLSPFLMGNNERYLRDLPFLEQAKIRVRPVRGSSDSVDIIVQTKDVLSLGGSIAFGSPANRLQLREDNFMGWGDRIQLETMYDRSRNQNFGFGLEYLRRNIMGTFIDGSLGYLNFNTSLSNQKNEEHVAFLRFVKPLVNPYMRWTYALNAELHSSSNMFNSDSAYQHLFRYGFRTLDGWAAWNPSAYDTRSAKEYYRLRYLISARLLDQRFSTIPIAYKDGYFYRFADVTAALAAVSVFRLNFYKTQFVYGFGRKEDIPEGVEATFTTGLINRGGRQRHFMGLSLEQYYLTPKGQYIDYSLKMAASVYKKAWEDITFLLNADYFSPLKQLGPKWKQRNFLTASIGTIVNPMLDEPFLVESSYGLPQYKNNLITGTARATVKAESVFFSPWSLLYFKFAPFAFGSATVLHLTPLYGGGNRLYSAFGGGIRTRNESLIFGTIELRASYFPKKDAQNNGFLVELNTNIRFKYNQNFIRRPEFLGVN